MEKNKAILKIESYSSKDGMLLLSVSDYGVRAMLSNFVQFLKEKYNGYIKLEMSVPYQQRTIPMNSKWWAMCTEYANYLGSTKEEVAKGVKYRAMDEGLWESSDVLFSNTGRKEPISTADADTKQMSVLIDVLYRIASEDGFVFSE